MNLSVNRKQQSRPSYPSENKRVDRKIVPGKEKFKHIAVSANRNAVFRDGISRVSVRQPLFLTEHRRTVGTVSVLHCTARNAADVCIDRHLFLKQLRRRCRFRVGHEALYEDTAETGIGTGSKAHAHVVGHIASYHRTAASDPGRGEIDRLVKPVFPVHIVLRDPSEVHKRRDRRKRKR